MMAKVIVGVEPEGSEQPALRWAVGYGRATGSALLLVTAWDPDQAEVPPDRFESMEQEVRDHAEREVARAAAGSPRVPYEVVVRSGSPDAVLAAIADETDAELIVIGHPSGAGARWTSSVLSLVNGGDLPAVIAQGPRPDLDDRPIIAAVDGSRADVAVLAWAAELATRSGGTVRPSVAVPAATTSYPHPPGATEADRTVEHLEEAMAVVESDERIPDDLSLTVLEGDPGEALTELAVQLAASMVVTGRGRGPLLDKVPAALVDGGLVDVAVVPETLPPTWHERHGSALPGEPRPTNRWQSAVGWMKEALGWAVADRRAEAHGELRRLSAADQDDAEEPLTAAEQEALLDEAELKVRRDHGDLPRGSELADAPRKNPPEPG